MDWLNLHTSLLDSAEFISAKPPQRATWLCLLRYCAGQENGGTIAACGDWTDRSWQQLCRVTKREVSEACSLWQWINGSLLVWAYPIDKENEVRKNRVNGSRGGRPLGSVSVKPNKTTRLILAETEQEGNGREGERKGKGKRPPGADAPPSLGRPANLQEAIAYFASKDAPASEAEKFFDYYEANGWRQGGRAVIRSWHSAANGWVRRWRDGGNGGEKNPLAKGARAPRGGPAAPFNPDTPHAHTGGLADAAAGGDA